MHHMVREVMVVCAAIAHVSMEHCIHMLFFLVGQLKIELILQVICILLFLVPRYPRTPCGQ